MKLNILVDESDALMEVESNTLDKLTRTKETEHYVFRFAAGSMAEQDMDAMINEQEQAYSELTVLFGFALPKKIEYFLLASPEENGEILREFFDMEPFPMNGFCIAPNYIFAVYNENIRCVGAHEVTHLFSDTLCMPKSQFLHEGLAMYADRSFWGKPNREWVREFLKNGSYVSVRDLASDERFDASPSEITYPIAGAFIGFLIERFGMKRFLNEVYQSDTPLFENLSHLLGMDDEEIEEQFKRSV